MDSLNTAFLIVVMAIVSYTIFLIRKRSQLLREFERLNPE
ncbi:CcmD family protein [Methanohalophilus halophilus]|uniref:CcmD family protein n=1 Tax=Methanohalophilus halophilus TaxID=2177 RepID=A0A3M9L8Y2_9EURY|nr:CcmD family protein [Methanohalophilus halophilus]RNI09791.1 CcmD family protein [Methanohalophilus halophilus]